LITGVNNHPAPNSIKNDNNNNNNNNNRLACLIDGIATYHQWKEVICAKFFIGQLNQQMLLPANGCTPLDGWIFSSKTDDFLLPIASMTP
jgi:hypothetical protein